MSAKTGIEWTDATWNPIRGCSRVSEGCRNCYAERTAARFAKQAIGVLGEAGPIPSERPAAYPAGPFYGFVHTVNGHPAWTGKVELVEKHLEDPLHWREPRRIFVNSMSDLFHEELTIEEIYRVFAVMEQCPQHTFQILTKRAARLPEVVGKIYGSGNVGRVLPHVWLGVSVEDQKTADERIPFLLLTPAAVRFVSYEPALDSVSLETGRGFLSGQAHDNAPYNGKHLDWIIVGGESGPGARPFDIAWARNTLAQCKAAGVACFVKQIGAKPYMMTAFHHVAGESRHFIQCDDRKGGNWDEWPADLRVREFPEVRA